MANFKPLVLDDDRLFPADPTVRAIARRLYAGIKNLPIVSPHGHTDPKWFASNGNFDNATSLLLLPDHYVFRMLYSQGISLEAFRYSHVKTARRLKRDYRKIFRIFASNYHLFRGTPSRNCGWTMCFSEVFGLDPVH